MQVPVLTEQEEEIAELLRAHYKKAATDTKLLAVSSTEGKRELWRLMVLSLKEELGPRLLEIFAPRAP